MGFNDISYKISYFLDEHPAIIKSLKIILLGVVGIIILYATNLVVWGTWRYKVTVEIETPEGLKTGSAVHQISAWTTFLRNLAPPEARHSAETFKGEAVVVDLGARGTVFMLNDTKYMLFNTIGYQGAMTPQGIKYYSHLKDKKGVVKPEKYSRFVMFKDPKDPKTVTLVRGSVYDAFKERDVIEDNFEKIFGAGVSIKQVTVEMTDEPVTQKINDTLIWLHDLGGGYLDGQFAGGGPELSNILHAGNFNTGE